MEKIKIGAVSYLNTKPLLYGIKHCAKLMEQTELVEAYPSKIADMLINGTIDAGLVPVTIIPQLPEWYIISDYCIGADGNVASVCLFSEVPLEKIEKVLLDYQSRTSVELCKILMNHHWKINPVLQDADENYLQDIKGTTAGVVVGDRALAQRKISRYMYDLAGAWKEWTGLPFVFAAWIANKNLPDEFIELFNEANAEGLQYIDKVIAENPFPAYPLKKYYTQNISYLLDNDKFKGLKFFLSLFENYQLESFPQKT